MSGQNSQTLSGTTDKAYFVTGVNTHNYIVLKLLQT